jgi:hypothetical protein
MKRCCCLLLLLSLVLCAEGCRRSSSEKKPPLLVAQESDFVHAASPDDLIAKIKVVPKDPPPLPDAKQAEFERAENDRKEKEKRVADTVALGNEFLQFRKETIPTGQTFERFRSFLRRKNLTELYKAVTANNMEVTFFSFPNYPQHILAWHKTDNDGLLPVFQAGAPRSLLQLSDLEARIKLQELSVGSKYALDYLLPHYTSMPPEQLKTIRGNNSPARTLALIKQTQPQFIKNPPEPRSLAKFKKYLQDNVSPEILKAVEENKIRVNLDADLYNDGDLLVCQSRGDPKIGQQADPTLRFHLTAYCDGRTAEEPAARIAQRFK